MNMNRIFCTILLLLCGGAILVAQPSKVTSGALAVTSGDYDEAIEKLELAIADKSLFPKGKAKHIPKAHYNLYKAYLAIGIDTSRNEPGALLKAKEYYLEAVNNPTYGDKWKKTARDDNNAGNPLGGMAAEDKIWGALYNQGITDFNNTKDESALTNFVAAEELKPNHIMTNRLLGSLYLSATDTAKCVEKLVNAVTLYKAKYIEADEKTLMINKAGQDFMVDSSQLSYMYQQVAVLYNAGYGDVAADGRKALEFLAEGMELIPSDDDMKRQELNIYQQNPALFEDARKKFDSAIAENPDDYQIKLAYANLLDRNEKADEAFKYYMQVNEADPENIGGIYGVGAYYINKAAEISNEKAKYTKEEDIDKADQEILKLVEKAYPYMQKLHELQPNERQWLSQLINITPMIGKDEEMEMYYEKMKALDGN